MLEFSSTESCTTSTTSSPLVGFSSNTSSCDGNVALMNDFESTEGCSGQGPQGPQGFSAYQIAVFDGFVGTEEQWLASLVGPVGPGVPVGGTAGQILAKINSTNYNTQWINNTDLIGLTSVGISLPTGLTVSNSPLVTNGVLNVTYQSGYAIPTTASQANWDIAYSSRITNLTTSGSSGAATLVSNVLNIPTYTLLGLGGVPTTTTITTTTPLTGGGDLSVNRIISIDLATSIQSGYLSNTDWNTFNSKFNLPSLTSGSVLFSNGTTIAQDNNNFFWDNTNKRLRVGTNTPANANGRIYSVGDVNNYPLILTDKTQTYGLTYQVNGTTFNVFSDYYSGSTTPSLGFGIFSNKNMLFLNSTGNVLINSTTDNGGKLQIKVGGASGTDIALRVRNSGDTADLMNFAGNGFMGIGVATPNNLLSVGYNSANTSPLVSIGFNPTSGNVASTNGYLALINIIAADPASGISTGAMLGFNSSASNFYGEGIGAIRNSKYDIWFQTGSTNGGGYRWYIGTSEKVTIDYLGNVGIGETSPLTTLDIRTSANTTITPLASVPNVATTVLIGNTGTNGVLAIGHDNTGHPWLQGRSRLAGAAAEDILINPLGGNVGIGTTTPVYLLDVAGVINSVSGSSTTDVAYRINGSGILGKTTAGNFPSNTGYTRFIGSGMLFSANNDNTIQMVIMPTTGNVGIGTTTPTAKLQVKGDGINPIARFEDTSGANGFYISLGGNILPISSGSSVESITAGYNGGFALGGSVMLIKKGSGAFTDISSGYVNGFRFSAINNTSISGDYYLINLSQTFSASAGSANFRPLNIGYTINNTGAQTGTATGIFLNATETALNGMVHNLIDLQVGGVSKFKVDRLGAVSSQSTIIGASVAAGTGGFYSNATGSKINSTVNGNWTFTNLAGTDFGLLQLGGTTNLFPAIKRNGAQLDFRLADDSGFCNINAGSITANAAFTVGSTGNDGTINLARGSNGAIVGAIIQTTSFTQIHNYQGNGTDFYVTAATNLQRAFVRSTGFGISGTTGGNFTLDASAALQVNSVIQGFLPPRMTNAQRIAIATPAVGLIVYCTDVVEGVYVNKSTGWTFIA